MTKTVQSEWSEEEKTVAGRGVAKLALFQFENGLDGEPYDRRKATSAPNRQAALITVMRRVPPYEAELLQRHFAE